MKKHRLMIIKNTVWTREKEKMTNKKDKNLQSNHPKQKKRQTLVRQNSINSGKPNREYL